MASDTTADGTTADGAPQRPVLRIISGDATDEEIAAILALLCARQAARTDGEAAGQSASVWAARSAAHRRARVQHDEHAGHHGWRTSLWPR